MKSPQLSILQTQMAIYGEDVVEELREIHQELLSSNNNVSLLQLDPLVEQQRLMKLQPILLRLKKLDKRTFGGLAHLVGAASRDAGEKMMG